MQPKIAGLPQDVFDFSSPDMFADVVMKVVIAAPLPTFTLYLTEAGDTTAISASDIHQGQIGDCFLLSSIGELAINYPSAISQMIHVNSNGSETVTLYSTLQGGIPGFGATGFKALAETVTNAFPSNAVNNGASQDVLGGLKEIWPQVIEKAYAQANGGYNGIQRGGNPCIALQQLTGHTATWEPPSAATVAALMRNAAAGDLVVMDTASSSNLPFNLVSNHAYMFEGLQMAGGVACVKLGNPWGFDAPSLIPVTQLSRGIVEVDIGYIR